MTGVIYLSGSGRSGSTLLERALHATGEVFSCGELHVLWRLPVEKITCSCGRRLPDCRIWMEILGQFGDHLDELAALEAHVCRTGFLGARLFSSDRVRRDLSVLRFLELQGELFAAIARVTGKDLLIDSSKAGPRAFLLSSLNEVNVVHLRREPGAVIASWRTPKFDKGLGENMARLSPGRAALDWMKAEYFARRIARRRKVVFLRYMDFCAAPRNAIARAAASSGLVSDGITWHGAGAFQPGPDYHSLNGNPDRFAQGPIAIVCRDLDTRVLSTTDRLAVWILGSLAARLFPER